MPTKYTRMLDNNNMIIPVEEDRVQRFLKQGWTIVDDQPTEKKSPRKSSKNKITADAQVTSETSTDYAWNDYEELKDLAPEQVEDEDDTTANKEE
jgi:hypothetical protein|tara:strand:+ start:103 stop:387 length:285 start_codon:yes stop_codon:yes gene_type:complete